jgi:predicted membrane protein
MMMMIMMMISFIIWNINGWNLDNFCKFSENVLKTWKNKLMRNCRYRLNTFSKHSNVYKIHNFMSWGRGTKFFQKFRHYLKILLARRITCSKFHTNYPQILGAVVQNLLATANWSLFINIILKKIRPCFTNKLACYDTV